MVFTLICILRISVIRFVPVGFLLTNSFEYWVLLLLHGRCIIIGWKNLEILDLLLWLLNFNSIFCFVYALIFHKRCKIIKIWILLLWLVQFIDKVLWGTVSGFIRSVYSTWHYFWKGCIWIWYAWIHSLLIAAQGYVYLFWAWLICWWIKRFSATWWLSCDILHVLFHLPIWLQFSKIDISGLRIASMIIISWWSWAFSWSTSGLLCRLPSVLEELVSFARHLACILAPCIIPGVIKIFVDFRILFYASLILFFSLGILK